MSHKLDRFEDNTPRLAPKERFRGDLMYKDVVFVYSCTITRDEQNGELHSWAVVPLPTNASVQESSLNGQATQSGTEPNRLLHLYTRKRNSFRWHDRVKFKDLAYQIESVEEKIENETGQFSYLYARALFISEKDFVDGTPAIFKGA